MKIKGMSLLAGFFLGVVGLGLAFYAPRWIQPAQAAGIILPFPDGTEVSRIELGSSSREIVQIKQKDGVTCYATFFSSPGVYGSTTISCVK